MLVEHCDVCGEEVSYNKGQMIIDVSGTTGRIALCQRHQIPVLALIHSMQQAERAPLGSQDPVRFGIGWLVKVIQKRIAAPAAKS